MIRLLSCLLSLALCPVVLAGNYGDPVPLGKPLPLAQAMASDPPAAGRLLFSGRITEVCQNKGCWLVLEDNGAFARVFMSGHSFSVPKEARSAAIVYGKLSVKQLDKAEIEHLSSEGSKPQPQELQIEASSVWIAGS